MPTWQRHVMSYLLKEADDAHCKKVIDVEKVTHVKKSDAVNQLIIAEKIIELIFVVPPIGQTTKAAKMMKSMNWNVE